MKKELIKMHIYVGSTILNETDLLKLFDFYEIPYDNGINYYDNKNESWFTQKLKLNTFDEYFYYIKYKKDSSLSNILNDQPVAYNIPLKNITEFTTIDFVIFLDERSDVIINENSLFYKDEKINIKYIGEFNGYLK